MSKLGLRPARRARADADPETSGPRLTTRKRFLRRQRARRWLVWRRCSWPCSWSALVAGAVWLVFFSSVLAVKGAEVTGVEALRAELEVETADVPLGVPLATARPRRDRGAGRGAGRGEVGRGVPGVAGPGADRGDRARAGRRGVWEGQWRGLDETGVLFRDLSPSARRHCPWCTMRAATPVEALAEAAAVVRRCPPELLGRVDDLEVASIDDISLRAQGRRSCRLGERGRVRRQGRGARDPAASRRPASTT